MENITVGQIVAAIGLITAMIGGGKLIINSIKDSVTKIVSDLLKPISDSIKNVEERLTRVDMESTKNFLVRCISDFERGEQISETELARFWEQYEHYIQNGGNTYIKEKVDKLKSAGKI